MSTHRILIISLLALNAIAFAGSQGWLGSSPLRTEPERLAQQLDPERIRLASDRPADSTAIPSATVPQAAAGATVPALAAEPAGTAAETEADPPPLVPPPEDAAESAVDTAAAEAPAPSAPQMATPAVAPPAPAPVSCVAWSELSEAQADALMRRLRSSGAGAERSKTETPTSWWVRIPPQGGREQAEQQVQELRALGVNDLFIVQDRGPSQYAISLGVFKTEPRARQMLTELRAKGVRNAGVEPRMSTAYRVQAQLTADEARETQRSVRGLAALRTACVRR